MVENMAVSKALKDYIDTLDMVNGGGVGRTDVWREQFDRVRGFTTDQVLALLERGHYMSCQALRSIHQKTDLTLDEMLAEMESAADIVRRQTKPILAKIKEKSPGPISMESRLGYTYFRHINIADEFLAFCKEHEIYPDWVVVRNYYYARNIAGLMRFAGINKPANFLEFGAGSGALAVILSKMGLVGTYTIVDLPEVLPFSAYEISRHLPDAEVSFGPKNEGTFRFVQPGDVDQLEGPIDVSLNFVSFAEMEKRWVDKYFETIYRISRPGALHYNVNRTHQNLHLSDGSHFYGHSLLYPYQPTDDIILWDSDPMQDVSRTWVMAKPRNPAYARAALVHGTGERRLLPIRAFETHSLETLLLPSGDNWTPWAPNAAR